MDKKKLTIKEIIEEGRKWEADQLEDFIEEVKRKRKEKPIYLLTTLISVATVCYMALTHDVRMIERTVDLNTGHSQYQDVYKVGETLSVKQQTVHLKSDIARFIQYYEGYSLAQTNTNMAGVSAFANSTVFDEYKKMVTSKNGVSSQIGDLGVVNVRIRHITPLLKDKNTMIAEVLLLPEGATIAKDAKTLLTLTIVFKYENVPTNEEMLFINPHGIVITQYHRKSAK